MLTCQMRRIVIRAVKHQGQTFTTYHESHFAYDRRSCFIKSSNSALTTEHGSNLLRPFEQGLLKTSLSTETNSAQKNNARTWQQSSQAP